MDALQQLKAEHGLTEGDVQHVEIGLPQTGLNIIGQPIAQKHKPVTIVDGQFSMPFLAAVILRTGNLGWDDYDSQLSDPVTLALTAKVDCIQDPKAEAEYPANMAGIARVTTSSGVYEAMVVVPKGEPDNFLTEDELIAKFDGLTAPYLSKSRRDALLDALLNLEKRASIGEVLSLTCPDLKALQMAGED
jgi:2-methylcitrate dehydratase PrpD